MEEKAEKNDIRLPWAMLVVKAMHGSREATRRMKAEERERERERESVCVCIGGSWRSDQ